MLNIVLLLKMADIHNNESSFNEAVLKMQRIDSAQRIINELRTNLLAWNPGYSKYNYEVVISELVSLCYEVSPLMKQTELEKFYAFRKLTDDILCYKPIHEIRKGSGFEERKAQKVLNYENWEILKNVMLLFEDFARKQVDVHGLSTMKKKDARLAAVDL